MPQNYIIAKFGGTSVADYDAMMNCYNIISQDPNLKVVVLSASAGVTNTLVELAKGCDENKRQELLDKIRNIQFNIINRLQDSKDISNRIEQTLSYLKTLAEAASLATNKALCDAIVSHGELMSTMIFEQLCKENGLAVKFLDARDVIVTNDNFQEAAVDIEATNANRSVIENLFADGSKVITQGFIAREPEGRTTTLGRGGSDYSAAIFAEIIDAKACHIWTDVSGIFTTDPRIISQAQRIKEISFREASEMAVFGAKVLHPATILPAVRANIPVFIGNSKKPHEGGTWIHNDVDDCPMFRGIAFKRNQVLFTVKNLKMLGSSGFLAEVFKIFTNHGLVIDCVTTSETSIALTLDQKQNQSQPIVTDSLLNDLHQFGKVTVEDDYSLIAIVGNNLKHSNGISIIAKTLEDFPIRMTLQGASENNICLFVNSEHTDKAIRQLHQHLFKTC